MKKIAKYLLASVFFLCLVSPVSAFWKDKVTQNQIRVVEYITKLQNGGDPDKIERPSLRREDNYKAKQANREMKELMDEAERLAREGKHELIEDPQFSIRGLSDEASRDMFGKEPSIKE